MSIKLVGEIGINHNGDVNNVIKLMSLANTAGLDYVKFQKRNVESCYTKEFLDSARKSPYGITQRDQKNGIELTFNDYNLIDEQCRLINMGWFASPWDTKSVVFLNQFNVPYIKVASASITDYDLLYAIKSVNIPIIISVGMSTKKEVDKCLKLLGNNVEYILACKSEYPTKNSDMNLNFIKTLKQEYSSYRIGFSNHNTGIQMCLASVILGVEMIEFHITLDRAMYGSDQSASIESTGVISIGKHVRALEDAVGTGEWIITDGENIIRKKLRK